MYCPACADTHLTMAERHGIEIDYCPKCRGVWLDRGELDKIIERAAGATAAAAPPRQAAPPPRGYVDPRDAAPPPPRGYPDPRHSAPYPPQYRDRDDDDDDRDHRGRRKRREGFLSDLFDFD